MSAGSGKDAKSSQISVSYYLTSEAEAPAASTFPYYYQGFYPRLFIDDVVNSMLPLRSFARSSGTEFRVVPDDEHINVLVVSAIARRDTTSSVQDAVFDFVEECARTMLAFSEGIYEIVILSEPATGAPVGFRLVDIAPWTVRRRWSHYTQLVPEGIARHRQIKTEIPLPPDSLLIFKLPPHLRQNYDHLMDGLAHFSVPSVAASNRVTQVREYTRVAGLANITRDIGWNARYTFDSKLGDTEILSYYRNRRAVLFVRFTIILRNTILATLNEGLKRAGEMVGTVGQIEVKGLPTLEDVRKAEMDLKAGNRSFEQILHPLRGY